MNPVRDETGAQAPVIRAWHVRAAIATAMLAAVGYLTVALWSGWHDMAQAARNAGLAGICIALVLSLVNYGLRFVRWQLYLGAMNQRVPLWPSLRIYLAGFALTTTPGKVGELLRSALLTTWSVPFRSSAAALISERLSDLTAIILLASVGLTVLPGGGAWVAIAAVGVASALVVLANRSWLDRLRACIAPAGRARGAIRGLLGMLIEGSRCNAPRLLVVATVISIVAWGAECVAFHIVLDRMGAPVPFTFAVSVYAISMLAGALSFMPGGLGGAEAAMTGLLVWHGLDAGTAFAATLIIRLATLWFAVAIGAAASVTASIGPAFAGRRQGGAVAK